MRTRRKASLIAAVLIILIGGCFASHRLATTRRIREIDPVLRELADALSKKDYGRARQHCASDFQAWSHGVTMNYRQGHPEDIRGTSDEHLAFVTAAVTNAPPADRPVLCSGRDGTYSYLPSAGGSFPLYVGKYYVFRKEDGNWKFTGVNGFMLD